MSKQTVRKLTTTFV